VEPLQYKCNVVVAGISFYCIESYDTVLSRVRDTGFNFSDGDEVRNESVGMRFSAPVELTVGIAMVQESDKVLTRAAFAPTAIAAVIEIPEDERNEAP
jgi:hypothetical protein